MSLASAVAGRVLRDPALLRAFVAIWRLPMINLRVRRADVDARSDSTSARPGTGGGRSPS
ncbi:MAG TPA: hypothetical protein VFW50_02675 [Streptosporangiaceae bacterium]|nr:hypothetical protein [Streptosporangiaceae bacterium]